MSETLPRERTKPGAALAEAIKATEARTRGIKSAAANRARQRMFVGDTEWTAEENLALQMRLKAQMYLRNPHLKAAAPVSLEEMLS